MLSIVDTGPLLAALDRRDPRQTRCATELARPDLELVIPALVVAEVAYLAGQRLGARVEAGFLRGLAGFDVRAPLPEDWSRIAELCEQYADFPLGGTDASVIALAERLDTDLIMTLDRGHFAVVRPLHVDAFRLLPDEG
jgi:predicted nucleic acid-binding protein